MESELNSLQENVQNLQEQNKKFENDAKNLAEENKTLEKALNLERIKSEDLEEYNENMKSEVTLYLLDFKT